MTTEFKSLEIKSIIKGLAVSYERDKRTKITDMSETVKELHQYVIDSFNSLPEGITVVFVDEEITDFQALKVEFLQTNILRISTKFNNSKLFPGYLNLWFRAVHDYVHITKNYGFGFEGEYKTYLEQSVGLSQQAKQVLFSEIVMQASFFLHFGYFKTDQKIVLYPYECIYNLTKNLNY